MKQPATKARVRNRPDSTNESASLPSSGLRTSVRGEEHDDGQGDQDDADRPELALEVGQGALLDRRGDLDHLGRALVGGQDALDEDEADGEGQQRGRAGEEQDGELAALQLELLVAPLAASNSGSCA